MAKFEITSDPNYVSVDFVAAHPYERTQALIDRGLIKILVPDGYVVADPRHIVKAEALNQVNNDTVAKKKTLAVDVKIENYEKAIEDALAEPNLALEDIDYVDEDDKKHKMAKKNGGVEVVSVVWREHEQNNKIYRYDPNGKKLSENDVVLIPATNSEDGTETVKKATIAHGNHVVDPAILKHPFKKIIAVIKHKVEDVLSSGANKK